MSIRFADLPTARTKTNAWIKEAAELRANAGQWAHFEEFDDRDVSVRSNLVQNIKNGKLKAFADGQFEARVINSQLWVRFVGDAA